MLKRHVLKLVIGLALVLTLLGGVTFGAETSAAQVAPAQHLQACGGDGFPPCW